MTSNITKPLVLVAGSTGPTGKPIVEGIVQSGNFRVAALIRPTSSGKPETESLRAAGVEIRLGDMQDGVEKLKSILDGVDIVLIPGTGRQINDQKDIIRAAKAAGVKRVIPSDFGTPGAKGVRVAHDMKLAIREFIQELGVGYTFIDIGWWTQGWLPLPSRSSVSDAVRQIGYTYVEDGSVRTLVTDRRRVGIYVARIIADPRTLNHAVMVWDDEPSQAEAQELGVRLSGEGEAMKTKFVRVSRETFKNRLEEGKREVAADPSAKGARVKVAFSGYMHSMLGLEENTLENAKRLGYLDVHELYPDIPRFPLEKFAEEFYSLPNPAEEYNAYS